MAHELTVTDKRGHVLHSRHIQQREEAFTAFDRAVARHNPDAAEITLMEGGHVNRRHTFAEVVPHDDAPDPEAAPSPDRERAGDAPVDAGDAPAAGEAAPQGPAPRPDAKPKAADEAERSKGRASNRPLTVAKDR